MRERERERVGLYLFFCINVFGSDRLTICLPSRHRTNRSDQELKADLDYLHDALQKDARDLR